MITPSIDREQCTGCGECVTACPGGVLTLETGYVVMVHPEDCEYCGDCEEMCSVGAISRTFEIILADTDDRSGRQ
jgi:NAD-dependent dihydropyrimidine dehydrogenase PreA subunit